MNTITSGGPTLVAGIRSESLAKPGVMQSQGNQANVAVAGVQGGQIEAGNLPLHGVGKKDRDQESVQKKKDILPDQIEQAVQQMRDRLGSQTDLEFSVDTDTKMTVIKVIDSRTKEVIRQMPPEDVLRLARNLEEYSGKGGVFVRDQA